MKESQRLWSLDALRGFDMVWIVGGRAALLAVAAAVGGDGLHDALEGQLEHALWHGFTAWDLIFPLFLFLAGVSLPYSFGRRVAEGASRTRLAAHALRRGLILVLLGMVYNGALAGDWSQLRWASVLGRIGLAWMLAAWIVIFLGRRSQVVVAAGIVLGTALAMQFVPVPGVGAGGFEQGRNLGDWIDQQLLPGRPYREDHDPEGLFSTIPAVATALLGSFAGRWLRHAGATSRASGLLALAGLGLLLAALVFQLWIPLNKRLWTPSFVLWCAGASSVLLALFHELIDVRGWRRGALPFVIVGANAIAAYLLHRFVDFEAVAQVLLGHAIDSGRLPEAARPVAALILLIALLTWFWRRRWFLKV